MTNEEKAEPLPALPRSAKCGAAIVYDDKPKEVAMGKALFTYAMVGSIDMDATSTLEVVAARSGATIYRQELEIKVTSGSRGLKAMTDDQLKEIMRPVLAPLV